MNQPRELQSLNTSLLRYALLRDPQLWTQFEKAGSNLDHWIDSYDPSINANSPLETDNERRLFQQLNRAYADYVATARAVHAVNEPTLVTAEQRVRLDAFDAQAERMRALVRELIDSHRQAERDFLAATSASLASLRGILITGVGILLALVATMGWVVYRDTIAPLRRKLVLSESMLEKQQKLATLGTLAAGIAHEIRNPLTSIKARLYTLERHLYNVQAARKDADIISAEISRLDRIVQSVLSFARPSEPELETVSAQALASDVQELLTPDLDTRGISLSVESDPQLLIRADSGYLKQALINLVRNAAEAIDGAGRVTLKTRIDRASLGGHETEVVVFEVTDNGKGMAPEVEKRLFDPFFTTKDTGTGLGLPIAARIVEKHGGLIQYHTRPGHGTTFGVVLPRENGNINKGARCSQSSAH
jgi:signal transduction histidine kinase